MKFLKKALPLCLLVLTLILVCSLVPNVAAAEADYARITAADQLVSGKYVLVAGNGYAPKALDGNWLSTGTPAVNNGAISAADAAGFIWNITVDGTSVKLIDANGVTIAPMGGNTNGIKSADYSWDVLFSDGTFQFAGIGSDTVKLACCTIFPGDNRFRAFKNTTLTGGYASEYFSYFTLYKLVGEGTPVDTTPTTPSETEGTQTTEPALPDGTELSIVDAIAKGLALENNVYTNEKYKVTGVITEVYNTTYGDMMLTDEAGNILTIYGTWSADGAIRYDSLDVKPVAGDTVTIYGIVGRCNNVAQIKNGWIIEHNAEETVPTESTEPTISGGTIVESGTCGDNLTWTLDDTGTLTISGTGPMKWSSYSSVPWYNNSFSIKAVVIEPGITAIGDRAFYSCTSMKSITIPDSVTVIGQYTFLECKELQSVVFGKGITTIGTHAFENCTGLQSINIPESVISIGDYAFWNCTGLRSVTIPGSVTDSGAHTFRGCSGLTRVTICDGVVSIGIGLFSGCANLQDVSMPNSVTSIGSYAFESCSSLTSINIPASVENIYYGAFKNCAGLQHVIIPVGVTSVANFTFEGCSSLESVTIPDGVYEVLDSAFYSCDNLVNVYFGGTKRQWSAIYVASNNDALTRANRVYAVEEAVPSGKVVYSGMCGPHTFQMQWKLDDTGTLIISGLAYIEDRPDWLAYSDAITTVIINPGVTEIGDYAFKDCINLQKITIPNSVTAIGDYAFWGCNRLENITIPARVAKIGERAFANCASLAGVWVDPGNRYYFNDDSGVLFDGNKIDMLYVPVTIEHYTIPDGIRSIDKYIFQGCTKLVSVTIPTSVQSIGEYAFCGCISLKQIVIPDNVTLLESNAFSGCTGLTNVTIGKGVTNVNSYAFNDCTSLKQIVIPDNVTLLASNAFRGCTGLTKVTIGKGVTNVNSYVFNNCTDLSEVILSDSVTNIAGHAFENCSNLESITITSGVKTIDYQAFYGCSRLSEIRVDLQNPNFSSGNGGGLFNKERTILLQAPAGILNYTIPEGTTQVAGYAFFCCKQLTDITIPASVNSVDVNSFDGCGNLRNFWVASDNPNFCNGNCGALFNKQQTVLIRVPEAISSYTIPTSIITIGDGAFRGCNRLQSVIIPDGVITIGAAAFQNCDGLQSVIIPDGVITIGAAAFQNCDGLQSIIIPDSVTTIGLSAFSSCNYLKEIRIGSSVEVLDISVFFGCTSLESIVIPKSVESIEAFAFSNCSGLKDIYYTGDPNDWDAMYVSPLSNEALNDAAIHYNFHIHDYVDGICIGCQEKDPDYIPPQVSGDFTVDNKVTNEDVLVFLWHCLFPEQNPIIVNADFTGDGIVDNRDVLKLLWYCLFPEENPL